MRVLCALLTRSLRAYPWTVGSGVVEAKRNVIETRKSRSAHESAATGPERVFRLIFISETVGKHLWQKRTRKNENLVPARSHWSRLGLGATRKERMHTNTVVFDRGGRLKIEFGEKIESLFCWERADSALHDMLMSSLQFSQGAMGASRRN